MERSNSGLQRRSSSLRPLGKSFMKHLRTIMIGLAVLLSNQAWSAPLFKALPEKEKRSASANAFRAVAPDKRRVEVQQAYQVHVDTNALLGTKITINLPNGKVLDLARLRMDDHATGGKVWVGEDRSTGATATLNLSGNKLSGMIRVGAETYRLLPTDAGIDQYILELLDHSKLPPDHSDDPKTIENYRNKEVHSGRTAVPRSATASATTDSNYIDIAFAYTPAAGLLFGGDRHLVSTLELRSPPQTPSLCHKLSEIAGFEWWEPLVSR